MIRSRLLHTLLLSIFVATATGASATLHFDIPAGDADETLKQFLVTARVEMLFLPEQVRGVRTNAINGDFTPREALIQMLEGTTLVPQFNEEGSFISVQRSEAGNSPPR